MPVATILGVVMAGGASRRMGFDKGEIQFEGQSLVERSALVLGSLCDEVVISVQPDAVRNHGEFRTIRDRRAHSGPLAGLESALADADAAARQRAVFLLACDMPHVGVEVVRYILAAAKRNPGSAAVVSVLDRRRQPLCALYRVQALATVRSQLESGDRSMAALLDVLAVTEVEIGPELPFYRADLFHNLNRPADLAGVAATAPQADPAGARSER